MHHRKAKSEVSAFSLKCLGLFTAQEAQEHSDIRAIAAASALDFLRAPDVFEVSRPTPFAAVLSHLWDCMGPWTWIMHTAVC